MGFNLQRFLNAQAARYGSYAAALEEIRQGRKVSHWIWYVFPQIQGLGHSYNARYYALESLDEARAYLSDEVLGARLREISEALLVHREMSARGILGDIDAVKVRSCMTLFDLVSPNDVFRRVLDTFYEGRVDNSTLELVGVDVKRFH